MENVSIATYLNDPSTSQYAHCNNFYDWFCSDKALVAKQKSLNAKVRKLAKSDKVNADKMYVWFKNNCPGRGPLYDSISIADLHSGDTIWWIAPKSGHTGKSEVFSAADGFKDAVVSGTWKDVLDFFGVK